MIRLAITTDRYEVAAAPFRRLGLEPVGLPCLRVEPAPAEQLNRARAASFSADLLLISSVRTLDFLWPHGSMPGVDVAAVGGMTAAAVIARGGRVVVTGEGGLADLVGLLGKRLAFSRIVFPHTAETASPLGAPKAPHLALETLRAQAADLHEFAIYQSVSRAPALTTVEAVAFSSPLAVAGWHLSRNLDGLVVGAIGATTREALATHRPPDVVAPEPSHQALARAMASYLEVSA